MAGLRLHLRDTVSVHEHRYRGRHWYLLRDTLGKQQYRLSQGVYQLIARLDGRQTLAEAYARFTAGRPAQLDPKPELLSTLTQLHAAGLLAADSLKDVGPLIAQQRQQRRKRNLSRWLRLLSPRMPLVDPDVFLGRTLPWVGWFFHPAALLVWLLLAAIAGLQALMHWDALALYGAQRLDDPQSWLLLVCALPAGQGAARTRSRLRRQIFRRRGQRDGHHPAGVPAGALCRRLRRLGARKQVPAHAGRCGGDHRRTAARGIGDVCLAATVRRPAARGGLRGDADRRRVDAAVQRQPAAALRRLLRAFRCDRDPEPGNACRALLRLPGASLPAGD